MSSLIPWIAAEAGKPWVEEDQNPHPLAEDARRVGHPDPEEISAEEGQSPHAFDKLRASSLAEDARRVEQPADELEKTPVEENGAIAYALELLLQREAEDYEHERERRIYRRRAVAMLRKYMQYSIETGRLPSLLGREFFRAKVTSYTVVTFEDRVIFVHDMETSLGRLDEFSRQLIARHILQEHDQLATARLLQCTERTVRRLTPLALDQLSEILLDRGLMERLDENSKKSCQGGLRGPFSVSDCEDSENKF